MNKEEQKRLRELFDVAQNSYVSLNGVLKSHHRNILKALSLDLILHEIYNNIVTLKKGINEIVTTGE